MLKITGLDEVTKKLDGLAKKAEELDGQHNIPIAELLNPLFISRYTRFSNVDEMLDASGFSIESKDDFAAVPDDQWDVFIRSVSSFSDWQEMLSTAGQEWVAKKLGF